MKRIICLLILIFCVQLITTAAQEKDPILEKAQKTLKQSLLDNAPSIVEVDFKQCRAVLKIEFTSGGAPDVSKGTAAAGGNFPKSEANIYLSGGGDTVTPESTTSQKLEINFADLGKENISIGTSAQKGMSILEIEGNPGKDTMRYRKNGKYEILRRFRVSVKTKSVEKTAAAVYDTIMQCEKYKGTP